MFSNLKLYFMIKNIYILLIALVLLNTYCKKTGTDETDETKIIDYFFIYIGQAKLINKTNYPIYIVDNPKNRGDNLDNKFTINIGDTILERIYQYKYDTVWPYLTTSEADVFFGKNLKLRLWDRGNFKTKDTVNYKYKSFHNIYNYSYLQKTQYPNSEYTYTFTEKDVKLADTIIN